MTAAVARAVLIVATGLWLALAAGGAGAWSLRAFSGWPDPTDPGTTLEAVEEAVTRRYSVPELTAAEVAASPQTLADAVVLDVREPAEFDQGHLAGARRVEPGISPAKLVRLLGPAVAGKPVLLYCAVGVRSGELASRARADLMKAGATAVYNLRGGMFRWRLSGGRLVTAGGAPGSVHPYDDGWKQLLDRTLQPPAAGTKQ